MRELMSSLCDDVDYQYRLRADFRRRRVHPTIEALVWGHVVGKPVDRVQLAADVTMTQKLKEERELFSQLSVEQLEELAAQSQALVDKALAMVRANALPPSAAADDVVTGAQAEQAEQSTAGNIEVILEPKKSSPAEAMTPRRGTSDM
jgi:hypothetical protein